MTTNPEAQSPAAFTPNVIKLTELNSKLVETPLAEWFVRWRLGNRGRGSSNALENLTNVVRLLMREYAIENALATQNEMSELLNQRDQRHDAERKRRQEEYRAQTEQLIRTDMAIHKLRTYIKEQRSTLQLALRTITNGARKKRGATLRQVRAILEAVVADPEPGSWTFSPLTKVAVITSMFLPLYALFKKST